MSTTFGIKIKDAFDNEQIVEVAFRSSYGIKWKNNLAQLLPDETPVIPMDNTAQGIYTIKDIKDNIIKIK